MSDPDDPQPMPASWRFASALGASAIGVGAVLLTYVLGTATPSPALVSDGSYALGCGGVVLGFAWLAAIKRGLGGFGAVAGSFAMSGAIMYASLHRDDLFVPGNAFLVFAGFLWFAVGHLVARGLLVTRFAAASATLGLGCLLAADAAHWHLSAEASTMLALLCGIALAFMGVALAFEMPRLKTSRWSL